MNKRRNAQAGFTFIELTMVMGVVALISFFGVSFSRDIMDSSIRFNRSLLTNQQLSQTVQVMLPELRSAAHSNDGSYPVIQAASTSITFFSDFDHDGIFERIRYFADGETFKKGMIEPDGEPLAYDEEDELILELVDNLVVNEPIFRYYPLSATTTPQELTTPTNILEVRMVKIFLQANQGTGSDPVIVGARNQATLRNLRYKQN